MDKGNLYLMSIKRNKRKTNTSKATSIKMITNNKKKIIREYPAVICHIYKNLTALLQWTVTLKSQVKAEIQKCKITQLFNLNSIKLMEWNPTTLQNR